jgi:hypothetical protein
MDNRRYRWLAALAVGTTLIGAACGSGGGSGNDVASLAAADGEQAAGQNTSDQKGNSDKDPEEAMLDFAKCMREHGIDMPDPEFTGGGGGAGSARPGVAIRIGGDGMDPEKMEKANEACRPLLADAGPMREMTPEERQEMQDKAIEHSRCMREHGIDMPDPVFDSSGGGAMVRISEAGKGGIDFDSEEFQEASEACGEIFGGAVKSISGGKASVGFSAVTPSGGSK